MLQVVTMLKGEPVFFSLYLDCLDPSTNFRPVSLHLLLRSTPIAWWAVAVYCHHCGSFCSQQCAFLNPVHSAEFSTNTSRMHLKLKGITTNTILLEDPVEVGYRETMKRARASPGATDPTGAGARARDRERQKADHWLVRRGEAFVCVCVYYLLWDPVHLQLILPDVPFSGGSCVSREY